MSRDSDRNEQQEDVIQPLQFFKCTKFGIVTLKACIGDSKKKQQKKLLMVRIELSELTW